MGKTVKNKVSDAISESKKSKGTIPSHRYKFKSQFLKKHASLLKKNELDEDDLPNGILVSVSTSQETRALGQVLQFCNYFLDLLFPDSKASWGNRNNEIEIDIKIIEEIEKESLQKKQIDKTVHNNTELNKNEKIMPEEAGCVGTLKKDKKVQMVDTACAGVLFVRFRVEVTPEEFIKKVLDYLKEVSDSEAESVKKMISHCSRFLPIQYTVPADLEDIKLEIKKLILANLEKLSKEPKTICVITDIRNNPRVKKEEVKNSVMQILNDLDTEKSFKVDLTDPDFVVLVSIFKSVAGLSFIPNYYRYYKKFNIQSFLNTRSLQS